MLEHLFVNSNYTKLERPVLNESEPVQVNFGIILQQLIDVVRMVSLCFLFFLLFLLLLFISTGEVAYNGIGDGPRETVS